MTARCCRTEIELRRVVIGRIGAIEVKTCECEAMRLTLRYASRNNARRKTKKATR
jgi:hypothetical protein